MAILARRVFHECCLGLPPLCSLTAGQAQGPLRLELSTRLYLMAILARRVFHECCLGLPPSCSLTAGQAQGPLRLELSDQNFKSFDSDFLVQICGLSGRCTDTRLCKFGLSKLAACHEDWYCQKAAAFFSPSGTLLTVWWVDIVKRQFTALLDPQTRVSEPHRIAKKGNTLPFPVSRRIPVTLPRKTRARRIPVTLPRKTRVRRIPVPLLRKTRVRQIPVTLPAKIKVRQIPLGMLTDNNRIKPFTNSCYEFAETQLRNLP